MIAAIALLDKIKNIRCHISKKRKRNMYNIAIKLKHEYKILPRSKSQVLQHKTELSRYVLWNFGVTEKMVCCRELYNLSAFVIQFHSHLQYMGINYTRIL